MARPQVSGVGNHQAQGPPGGPPHIELGPEGPGRGGCYPTRPGGVGRGPVPHEPAGQAGMVVCRNPPDRGTAALRAGPGWCGRRVWGSLRVRMLAQGEGPVSTRQLVTDCPLAFLSLRPILSGARYRRLADATNRPIKYAPKRERGQQEDDEQPRDHSPALCSNSTPNTRLFGLSPSSASAISASVFIASTAFSA